MSLVKQGRGQIVMPGFVNHGVSSILTGFDAFKLWQTVTSSRRRFVLGTLLALLLLNTGFVVSASAQSSALDSILNPSILGAQVPYLESKVGPAWQVVPGYAGLPEERVYKIDQCTFRTGVSNNTISYVKLDLSPSCSVNLNSFIIRSPAIPPAKKLTFGIFDSIVGPGTYSTECFSLDCPASSPTFIYDKYDGPMSDNSIGIIAVASAETQSAMNASTSWEQSIKSGTNTFGMFADTTLDQKRYNCNGAFNSQAASAFQNTPLNSIIIVGAVPGGVQPLGPWSGCPMAQVDAPLPAEQIQPAPQVATSTPLPVTASNRTSSQPSTASDDSVSNVQNEIPIYVPVILLAALFGLLIYSTDRLIDTLRRRATISIIFPVIGVSLGFVFAFAMTWLIFRDLETSPLSNSTQSSLPTHLAPIATAVDEQSSSPTVDVEDRPTFRCPQSGNEVRELICENAPLGKLQFRYSLYSGILEQQTGPEQAAELDREEERFNETVAHSCLQSQIGGNIQPQSVAENCLIRLYAAEISSVYKRLSPDAREEANRPINSQTELGHRLQKLGFLDNNISGLTFFSSAIRQAVVQWQLSSGLNENGLLNNQDAELLMNSNVSPSLGYLQQQWIDAHRLTIDDSTHAIPPPFQGIWSIECANVINGTSSGDYFVYGADYIADPPSDGSSDSTSKVIDFVVNADNNDFAVSDDDNYNSSESQDGPNITIAVYHTLPDGGIKLAAVFHNPDAFNPNQQGDQEEEKCPNSPTFAQDVSEANETGGPTAEEISASHTAFADMPNVDGVRWIP